MGGIRGCVRIVRAGDDPTGDGAESPEQPPRLRPRGEEAEVVPVHDDRVEVAERRVDVLEGEQADIGHAALPRYFYGSGRDVDRDHLTAARLQLEGDASGAYADVEHAAPDEAQRSPLHR